MEELGEGGWGWGEVEGGEGVEAEVEVQEGGEVAEFGHGDFVVVSEVEVGEVCEVLHVVFEYVVEHVVWDSDYCCFFGNVEVEFVHDHVAV